MYFDELVKREVLPKTENKRYQWDFCFERIWGQQFWPLLEEAAQLANTTPLADAPVERELRGGDLDPVKAEGDY
jgi:hypothetical protein